MKKAYFIMGRESFRSIYGEREIEELGTFLDVSPKPLVPDEKGFLADVPEDCQIVMSGWGGPRMDGRFLGMMPHLEAVFYGAGSLRSVVTDEFWDSDVVITSSWAANAVPVAEYTLAQVILCLKNAYKLKSMYKRTRTDTKKSDKTCQGAYGTTVGIISLGMIGRMVCRLLGNMDVNVVAYDPYASDEDAGALGVKLVDLATLFRVSHVVSLHAPLLAETRGMIKGRHFSSMMRDASFINTARGAIVDENAMVDVLRKRPDITAVLDVTYPEPPPDDSPLYDMENVFLTPHIAGSLGDECRRMGAYAVEEARRYISGEPLEYEITRESFGNMA